MKKFRKTDPNLQQLALGKCRISLGRAMASWNRTPQVPVSRLRGYGRLSIDLLTECNHASFKVDRGSLRRISLLCLIQDIKIGSRGFPSGHLTSGQRRNVVEIRS